jgi:hypothetical protein
MRSIGKVKKENNCLVGVIHIRDITMRVIIKKNGEVFCSALQVSGAPESKQIDLDYSEENLDLDRIPF